MQASDPTSTPEPRKDESKGTEDTDADAEKNAADEERLFREKMARIKKKDPNVYPVF